MKKIKITEEQVYQIFLEWNKEWFANPELYSHKGTPEELATGQASLFLDKLNAMNNEKNIS